MQNWLIGNDIDIRVQNLKDLDGTALEGATVTGTLYGPDGIAMDYPITFIDDGEGGFIATLPSTLTLIKGRSYRLNIVVNGDTFHAEWDIERVASERAV